MGRGRWLAAVGVALVAPLLFIVYATATSPVTVRIGIHFSHFDRATISVPRGRPVTFIIENTDPIDHEWIVGTEAIHAVHRIGTEAHHGSRPTELSIGALESQTTTITFAEAGTLTYICHLPGHEAYGMVGTLEVH